MMVNGNLNVDDSTVKRAGNDGVGGWRLDVNWVLVGELGNLLHATCMIPNIPICMWQNLNSAYPNLKTQQLKGSTSVKNQSLTQRECFI